MISFIFCVADVSGLDPYEVTVTSVEHKRLIPANSTSRLRNYCDDYLRSDFSQPYKW